MTHWTERHKLVAATYVLFERDGKVLLIRRAGSGYMDGYYSPPAGHIDENESAKQAAVREMKEEVLLDVGIDKLELAHCMVYRAVENTHDRISLFFKVTDFTGEPQIGEPDKADDLGWFSYGNLPEKMVWEVEHALAEIQQGKVYSEANYEV